MSRMVNCILLKKEAEGLERMMEKYFFGDGPSEVDNLVPES